MQTIHGKTPPPHVESRAPFDEHILEQDLAQRCMAIIERFRKTELDKGLAMVKIARTIGESQECTGTSRANSITAYFRMLESDEPDNSRTLTTESGHTRGAAVTIEQRNPGPATECVRADQPSLEEGTHEGHRDTEGLLIIPRNQGRSTRKRRIADSGDEDSEDDLPRKLDTSRLPWEIKEVVSPANLRPELRQTHDLLKLFMEDFKAVKASLAVSPRRPEFPESEWDNIIRGRAVDLNKVLSAMFVIGSDSR
jgi:hypothetical protein